MLYLYGIMKMSKVDLSDLSNIYLLTYTSTVYDQISVWYEEQIEGITCRIYKIEKTMIVTFSPFDCQNFIDYFRIGGKLVWQQDMIDCKDGKMNRFFHNVSQNFVDRIRAKKPKFSKLIITGMSMGAALGQCFYYHFKPSVNTKIYAFGSPRIGDANLRSWFEKRNSLTIANYALFRLVDGCKRIDPVCLFPSCKYGVYVNNSNMKMLYEGQLFDQAEYIIDGPDTEITLLSILCNCGLDKETSHLWDLIHDTDKYYSMIALQN
jgi:hypothetical protein